MTAEEALQQAQAEGLTLLRAESSNSGYKSVTFDRNKKTKPYQTYVRRGGENMGLGRFVTAEEAALAFARDSAAHAAPPQPSATSSRKCKAKSEAEPPDMSVEVVTLDGQFVVAVEG